MGHSSESQAGPEACACAAVAWRIGLPVVSFPSSPKRSDRGRVRWVGGEGGSGRAASHSRAPQELSAREVERCLADLLGVPTEEETWCAHNFRFWMTERCALQNLLRISLKPKA